MDRPWELSQGVSGRELYARVSVHRDGRNRVVDRHQPARVCGGLCTHARHQGLQHVPHGVLHAEPDRRHRAGLHLVDDLRRHPLALWHIDRAQYDLRLLGPDHPHGMAADRLHDDHLHRWAAIRAGRSDRSREDRRRERLAHALAYHDSDHYALDYDLHVPDADQLV